ncbi:MAG: hypothetical protein GXP48_01105 [Acidobacteria bacterium]|nr:hypothetical protein [Acidobacteriota bacterium]
MQSNEKHKYHGMALAQIVEYEQFSALNPAPDHQFGHYRVNHDRELYVKYRTAPQPSGASRRGETIYQFTVSPEETQRYAESLSAAGRIFLALVCADDTVIGLNQDQMKEVLAIPSTRQEWIEVTLQREHSPRVRGSASRRSIVVPHNSFPKRIFED